MAKNGTFFSLITALIARLTPVLEPPSSMVMPFWSAHSRAFCAPRSGLFWWSKVSSSIGWPSDGAAEIGDRHFDRFDAVRADHVGVGA